MERRKIEGYPDYEVDTNGDVWSLKRGKVRKMRPSLMGSNGKKYRTVGLCNPGAGVRRMRVGILVLTTFVGPRPDGCVVRYLNDCEQDDRLTNLAWGTPSQNNIDARNNGKGRVKLDASKVRELKRRLSEGERVAQLAKEFGIVPMTVYQIKNGDRWADVA